MPSLSRRGKREILSDDEFNKMYAGVLEAIDRKAALGQEISAANTEIDRISAWGDFSPQELASLKDEGFDFHFYRMGEKEFQALQAKKTSSSSASHLSTSRTL